MVPVATAVRITAWILAAADGMTGRDHCLPARGPRTHDLSVSAKARAFVTRAGDLPAPTQVGGQGRPVALPGLAAGT